MRSVAIGEADRLVTFFTEAMGIAPAMARSARRSTKRFAALEPMHLLRVAIEQRPGAEIGALSEASIERPRTRLVGDLDRLEAAGRALRWVRRAAPPHTPEPELWEVVNDLLDRLDAPEEGRGSPDLVLAAGGLGMLSAMGWGLDFERCVRCGKVCDPKAAAYVDALAGGLVCRACGGGRIVLKGEQRARLATGELQEKDAAVAIDLVETAFEAHAT